MAVMFLKTRIEGEESMSTENKGFGDGNIAKLKAKWKRTQRKGFVDAKQRGAPPGVQAQRYNPVDVVKGARKGQQESAGPCLASGFQVFFLSSATFLQLAPQVPQVCRAGTDPSCVLADVHYRGKRQATGTALWRPPAFRAGSRARLLEAEFKPRPGLKRANPPPEVYD